MNILFASFTKSILRKMVFFTVAKKISGKIRNFNIEIVKLINIIRAKRRKNAKKKSNFNEVYNFSSRFFASKKIS